MAVTTLVLIALSCVDHSLPAIVTMHNDEMMPCVNGKWNRNGYCQCYHGYTGERCEINFEQAVDPEFETKKTSTHILHDFVDFDLKKTPHKKLNESHKAPVLDEMGRKQEDFRDELISKSKPNADHWQASNVEDKFDLETEMGFEDQRKKQWIINEIKRDEMTHDAFKDDDEDMDEIEKEDVLLWQNYAHESSFHKTIQPKFFQILDNLPVFIDADVECVYGSVKQVFKQCMCDEGYTGDHCQTHILNYEASGHKDGDNFHEDFVKRKQQSLSEDKCLNGIPVYSKKCMCLYGYYGEACQREIEGHLEEAFSGSGHQFYKHQIRDDYPYSGERTEGSGMPHASGLGEHAEDFDGEATVRLQETEGGWVSGFHSGDMSGSGSGGVEYSAQESNGSKDPTKAKESSRTKWTTSKLDAHTWVRWWKFLSSNKDIAASDHILENKFIAVSTGIQGTKSVLHVKENKPFNSYRFSFVPKRKGGKSRLELTTCFTTPEHSINMFGTTDLNPSIVSSLGTVCPIVHQPIDAIHTHSYEMYFPKGDFPQRGKYIVTQWHGSADPTIVRDEFGCTARLSHFDKSKLCKKYACKQGSIFNRDGSYVGLQYVQGGYPPLTLSVDGGEFLVTSRLDERVFIEKGGCGWKKSQPPYFRCPLHPHQQFHLLARFPFSNITFDSWIRFEWKIKWSEFSVHKKPKHNKDPGFLSTNAWIRLSINNVAVVDWTGPCGRNDFGRVPYFKIGMYNPSGSEHPVRLYMRDYRHDFTETKHLSTFERRRVENLPVVSERQRSSKWNLNRNAITEPMVFRHVSGDARCELRAKVDHVANLMRARFSRMKVDKVTLDLLKTMTLAIEAQDFKIRQLEKKLDEKIHKGRKRDEEDVGDEVEDLEELSSGNLEDFE